ncbi:MAG: hypothetical protein ABIL58_16625 [Pseudomonadota bacterium]
MCEIEKYRENIRSLLEKWNAEVDFCGMIQKDTDSENALKELKRRLESSCNALGQCF